MEVAASNGFADILQIFREIGPELVRQGNLKTAIEKGDLEVVNPSFHGEVPAEVREKLIEQFLEHAATRGSVVSIKYMIDGGLEVNRISKTGLTSLMMAAMSARLDITGLLLQARAFNPDSFQAPLFGYTTTALYYAAPSRTERNSEAVVKCLINHEPLLVDPRGIDSFSLVPPPHWKQT